MKNVEGHTILKSIERRHFRTIACISLMLISFFIGTILKAQTSEIITVKGIVTDQEGEPLIGASVAQKGTTNGYSTGIDGDYTLTIPSNATIVVTYVGFHTQEITVGGKTTINIKLIEDSKVLDEVVVTALGIKRDRKSLGYALSEVKGDELTETRDANIANALSGKVAGLQIKQSGTGPSGSSRIVLRGNNSIAGNNQPLVVVDGVPINSETGGSDDYWGNRKVDKGSGMADISPDDIEAISVLKGPAAAALYGSRAGNGVIMITTKTGKGAGKGIGISFNTNLTFDSPMQTPEFQNTYGQGDLNEYSANTTRSWGARMTGQSVKNHIGETTSYNPTNNNLYKDFLQTGTTWTNSLDFTNATDKNTVRLGVMNLKNKGVVPNSSFSRTSFTLRSTAKLTDKLSLDAKVTYVNQKTDNRIKLGGDPDNIFNNYLMMPRSVHFSDMNKPETNYEYPTGTVNENSGNNLGGKPIAWTDQYGGMIRNPYWAAYRNTNNDRKDRFLGFASMKYELTDWLNIQGRYGMDYIAAQYKNMQATNTPYWQQSGDFIMEKDQQYEINSDFLITFNKNFNRLGVVATAGGNIMYKRSENMWSQTNGLLWPNLFQLSNAAALKATNTLNRKQINSLYATASLAWDDMIYLDLSARNDWSSTLNPDNRSYFYPSVGTSWLFTETLKKADINPGPLNFGKIRVSWAQVGNDTDPYQLSNYRQATILTTVDGDVIMQPNKSEVQALYNLKNETIESWEVGLEMRAFNNRVGLDLAIYNKDAKDQILKLDVPQSTGWSSKYINAGKVRNRGIELLLTGTPVQTKDFQWDITLNWSKNKNKIVELAPGVANQQLSDDSYASQIRIYAQAGGSYGDIYGKAYRRNDKGEILIGTDGLPTFNSEYTKLGNASPDWMGGLNNTLRYKDFDLSFQIDMRYGGEVYMGSIRSGASSGTLAMTESGRESMIAPGVLADGTPNNITTTAQKYWGALTGGSEPWMYDATNIRLREVSFGYKLPRKLLAKTPIQSAKLSFIGRNLWMIHSKTEGFDPEAGFSTGNAQGFEYGSMPTLRSLGFNINITF